MVGKQPLCVHDRQRSLHGMQRVLEIDGSGFQDVTPIEIELQDWHTIKLSRIESPGYIPYSQIMVRLPSPFLFHLIGDGRAVIEKASFNYQIAASTMQPASLPVSLQLSC